MTNLFIQETYVNATQGHIYGESGFYETFTGNIGQLFRSLQQEYGKAQRMYRDFQDGASRQVGWVFTGKAFYEDTQEPYTREVWVEVASEVETIPKQHKLKHPWH